MGTYSYYNIILPRPMSVEISTDSWPFCRMHRQPYLRWSFRSTGNRRPASVISCERHLYLRRTFSTCWHNCNTPKTSHNLWYYTLCRYFAQHDFGKQFGETILLNLVVENKIETHSSISSSASRLTGTRQPLIWFSFWSAIVRSISLISGTHTMKCAVPVYVSYLTITVALDDPRISDPSTYTELHDDVTCTGTSQMHK